jgi:aryl-alcohol dehydrogenase-like predicted oxidoreductase
MTADASSSSDSQATPGERRRVGETDIDVTPVAMGCWPISGITSVDVTPQQSRATLAAAYESGIIFFDTAYCYGYAGESERMIAEVLGRHRDEIVIATKGGIHWSESGKQVRDARPKTLRRECEESLRRLKTDRVDLIYLHAPDRNVPIQKSAAALYRLMAEGKTRSVGLSNATVEELEAFATECPLAAYQPHYNLLQREIESSQLPWCVEHQVSVVVYWPLMKGLLAGRMARDHQFDPRDGRQKYPMYQGEEWQRNQDFVERLRAIAADAGKTVAQLVINWTIHQPGITAALCGAKRPAQIRENAGAMNWRLTDQQRAQIERALAERGPAASRAAV